MDVSWRKNLSAVLFHTFWTSFLKLLTWWNATPWLNASANAIIFDYMANFSGKQWPQCHDKNTHAPCVFLIGWCHWILEWLAWYSICSHKLAERRSPPSPHWRESYQAGGSPCAHLSQNNRSYSWCQADRSSQKFITQALNRNRLTVHWTAIVSMLRTIAYSVTYRPTVAAADIVLKVCLATKALYNNSMLQPYAMTLFGNLSWLNVSSLRAMEQPDVIKHVTRKDKGTLQCTLIAMPNHEEVLSAQNKAIMTPINCFVAYPRMHASFFLHGDMILV